MADRSGAVLHWPAVFMTWWTAELAGCLPQAFRRSSVAGKPCLIFVLENDEITLIERTVRRGEREIARFSMREDNGAVDEPSKLPKALADLGKRRYRRWPLVLRLSGHLGLRKQVDLPLAAKSDLAQLLHFELDRLTPFKAEDVRFAWRILETDNKAGRMQVALEMAPKSVIDSFVEIAQQAGRAVDRVELEGGHSQEGALNLLPPDPQGADKGGWLNRVLGATTLALLAVAIALPLKKQMAVISALDTELAVLRTEAEESLALRQRLEQMSDEASFLSRARHQQVTMTELFAELTRLLPDQSHLRTFRVSNGAIELNGLAEEPSELLAILDQSPMLASPTFSSPVIRDPQSGQNHFQISAVLAEGGA